MYSEVERRVARLLDGGLDDSADAGNGNDGGGAELLSGRCIGLEKESLRVRPSGAMSQLDHPSALGASLTNPAITTDFSEAQLEMVTPPSATSRQALDYLAAIHRYILPRLPDGEHLWNTSMPCVLHGEQAIRIGEYGPSHTGRMKHIYRRGLGERYGRRMQAISGIHFNFSFPDSAWSPWHSLHKGDPGFSLEGVSIDDPLARMRTAGSFSTMRNLTRIGWLVPYLFGASPAICKSFLQPGEATELSTLNDSTRYAPHGTSLRMGNIGYRYRDDQPIDLSVRHDRFDDYVADIIGHVTTAHPAYAEQGTRNADGEWIQLNTSRLQIENEFYSTVRPKQVPNRGEMPILALERRGVRYLELRSVDVSIEQPYGLDESQCAMLEMLMMFAWLDCDRALGSEAIADATHNVRTVAHRGREPDLELRGPDGPVKLVDWGLAIIDALAPLAEALDHVAARHGHSAMGADNAADSATATSSSGVYAASLIAQRAKFLDPDETPSARVLKGIVDTGSYFDYTMKRSQEQHAQILTLTPDPRLEAELAAGVQGSIEARAVLESQSDGDFDTFLDDYFAQLPPRTGHERTSDAERSAELQR